MKQRKNSCKGDWVKLVEQDFEDLQIAYDEEKISSLSDEVFRKNIISSIRSNSFRELQTIKEGHEKVRDISFEALKGPQEYLCNSLFTNRLSSLLFNLRCRSVRSIKDNFHRQFQGNLSCPFLCPGEIDTQENLLVCVAIKKHLKNEQISLLNEVQYKDIFGSIPEQYNAARIFDIILKVRHRLLEKDQRPAHHGNNSGPIC